MTDMNYNEWRRSARPACADTGISVNDYLLLRYAYVMGYCNGKDVEDPTPYLSAAITQAERWVDREFE